jgi:hypothetical protein
MKLERERNNGTKRERKVSEERGRRNRDYKRLRKKMEERK